MHKSYNKRQYYRVIVTTRIHHSHHNKIQDERRLHDDLHLHETEILIRHLDRPGNPRRRMNYVNLVGNLIFLTSLQM